VIFPQDKVYPPPLHFRKCLVMNVLGNHCRHKCFIINQMHPKYRKNKALWRRRERLILAGEGLYFHHSNFAHNSMQIVV